MTRLDSRKTRLIFTTCDTVRERGKLREIILEPTPYLVSIRLKGCRQRLTLSYGAIYNLAAKIAAEAARKERIEKKKARVKQC
jgi:hypothetical protein